MKITSKMLCYPILGLLCSQTPVQARVGTASLKTPVILSDTHQKRPNHVLLKDCLKDLEAKFNVSIAYQTELLENVEIDTKILGAIERETSIEKRLDKILKDLKITYQKSREGFYVLYREGNSSGKQARGTIDQSALLKADATQAYANKAFGISGKVVDKVNGAAIPGVNILLKGSNIGTTTDVDGAYRLDVPTTDGILVFSYIGFVTQEVPIANKSVIDVVLNENVQALSEVVVTALGFKEAADRLGSTSSKVSGDAITKSGETSLINGLAGKAAGVQISRAAGDPGAALRVLSSFDYSSLF